MQLQSQSFTDWYGLPSLSFPSPPCPSTGWGGGCTPGIDASLEEGHDEEENGRREVSNEAVLLCESGSLLKFYLVYFWGFFFHVVCSSERAEVSYQLTFARENAVEPRFISHQARNGAEILVCTDASHCSRSVVFIGRGMVPHLQIKIQRLHIWAQTKY